MDDMYESAKLLAGNWNVDGKSNFIKDDVYDFGGTTTTEPDHAGDAGKVTMTDCNVISYVLIIINHCM